MRWLITYLLLSVLPWVAYGGELVTLHLTWDPPTHWDDPSQTPATPDDISHYFLYVCDSPILAGGPNTDDPLIEQPVCVGSSGLSRQRVDANTVQATYTVETLEGSIHVRVSVVSTTGGESRLSTELVVPYSRKQLMPPTNLQTQSP
jgi:hypothetical protein